MKVYRESGQILLAIKIKRPPKMSAHRGRTWDSEIIMLEEKITEFFLDTTWGLYYYF